MMRKETNVTVTENIEREDSKMRGFLKNIKKKLIPAVFRKCNGSVPDDYYLLCGR